MGNEEEKFHISQEKIMASTITDPKYIETSKTWMQEVEDTVNNRRLKRIEACFLPLLKNYQGTSWLTVGDGRFGSDAHFLDKHGVEAIATDIQDELLKEGFKNGFIKAYAKQNAEKLTYDNNSFDFVFCKEAYHHFPRPAIAVYEMLRVAKTGIVLHEPKDVIIYDGPVHALVESVKRSIRKFTNKHQTGNDYEVSGNYVYTISKREIEKIAMGLNYKCVAFHNLQDHYVEGSEFQPAGTPSKISRTLKRIIQTKELLFRLGLYNGGMLTAIIFKKNPTDKVLSDLKAFGYEIRFLPDNPYIN